MDAFKRKRLRYLAVAATVVAFIGLHWLPRTFRRGHGYIAPRTSPSFSERPKNHALTDAAEAGDLAKIRKLLDSGVSPDACTSEEEDQGTSALSVAASSGQFEAVKLLLERGADVNADDFLGGNALTGASVTGNVEIVELLVSKGCDPNAVDDGTTALDYASHQLVEHETTAPLSNYRKIVQILETDGARHSAIGNVSRFLGF